MPKQPTRKPRAKAAAEVEADVRHDALQAAQAVIYDAWEATTKRSRLALVRKALKISPLCADAYNILGDHAETHEEARDLYAKGLAAGEEALGPEGFSEFDGHFWGFLETRPYMRARAGLATTLIALGEDVAAIGHLEAMLALNPGDNQGLRYILAACLLRRNDIRALKALLNRYGNEGSPQWLYTRALLAFRDGGEKRKANALVREAWGANEYVPAMLAGAIEPPVLDRGYILSGGPDEAAEYCDSFGAAWQSTPGAIAWLVEVAATCAPRTKPARTFH